LIQHTQQDEATYRSRPLLTVDEVITPQAGNATIFARYVDPGYATQIILTARLTRFYERKDWAQRIKAAQHREPILLERGLTIRLKETAKPQPGPKPMPPQLEAHFNAIYEKTQQMPAEDRQQKADALLDEVAPHHGVFNASLSDLRR
jgi:hypothetical protein